MREQTITVANHAALVMELGRHMDCKQWWMRPRGGFMGLEAIDSSGRLLRLELQEPQFSEMLCDD